MRLIEAFSLRKAEIKTPVILLAPIIPSQASWIVKYNITLMTDSESIVEALERYASENFKLTNVHIKINTGLNRYGLEPDEAIDLIRKIREKYLHIKIEGVYTHFQSAEYDTNFTKIQMDQLNYFLDKMEMNLFPGQKPASTLVPMQKSRYSA